MAARLLDGKALAQTVRGEIRAAVAALGGRPPGLAVVLVGDDPASQVYVRNKERAAAEVGIAAFDHRLAATVSQAELLALVERLNGDPAVDGILVQLPLPAGLDATAILDAIRPDKDVDGFHADNLGRLAQGRPRFVAATPKGCMLLLAHAGVELRGKHAVVLGRSNIVGRPMALLLLNADATVTICHSRTADLAAEVARADVLVAAIGRPRFVPPAWLKPGVIVIDVGINRMPDGKLTGDVDPAAADRASALTPVPGGVGPMTIACLLENTLAARVARG